MQPAELTSILSACARLLNKPRIDYYQALEYLQKLGAKRGDASLVRLVKNHIPELVQLLNDLERTGAIALLRDGATISSIEVASYYGDALKKIYASIAEKPSIPFPDTETLKMEVPPANLLVSDIKKDFVTLLRQVGSISQEIVRIDFPDGIASLYLPRSMLGARLVEMAVAKVSLYLQDQRNLGFVSSKLRSILGTADIALNNALADAVSRPSKASQSLSEPGEFTLKFWTTLASQVLQDLTKKKDKSRDDHGYCQSCYVIGHYVVYQRSVLQHEQERVADGKRLEGMVKKPPYAFSMEDLLALGDAKGVPFVRKHSRQFLVDFLQARIQTQDTGKLAPLVRVKAPGNREYFISREFVAPLYLSKLHETASELKKQYLEEAKNMIRSGERTGPLADDQRFAADVMNRVREGYPLLHCLFAPELLFFAREEHESSSPVAKEIASCFAAPGKLHPTHLLMDLDRKKVLKDAGSLLPAFYTMPVVSQLYFLFKRLLTGSRKKKKAVKESDWVEELKPASESPSAPAGSRRAPPAAPASAAVKELAGSDSRTSAAYKTAVKSLVKEFAGSEKRIDGTLAELAEKWNPLFDEAAKRNLVTDVDSYVRDFVRSLRKGFRVKPPDAARIRNLAWELSQKEALSKIRKKDYLQRYIELSMIRLLIRR